MDHFERELARMMRDSQESTRYEDRHRHRLQAGVRARWRTRTSWMATGSALSIAGLGAGLMLLQSPAAQGGSPIPEHGPVTPAASVSLPPTVGPRSPDEPRPVPIPPYRSRSAPKPVPMPTITSPASPVPMPTAISTTGPVPTQPPTSTAR